ILNHDDLDFQKETLAKFNLNNIELINTFKNPDFHIQTENLYVPSYPNKHGTVNKWVCDEVKEMFQNEDINKKKLDSKFAKQNSRLYISRRNKTGRNFINEEELFHLLEKFGFQKIYCEDYSIAEKVYIFGKVECVIGPHGSGLGNILFCNEGCTVVNIFSPNYFDTFIWSLANANKLKYHYFFGEGEIPIIENDITKRNIEIEINLDKFKKLITKILN
ncbi:MAG: glycosyltransferase family 61 protein, partial [Bacteroidia bacterium]